MFQVGDGILLDEGDKHLVITHIDTWQQSCGLWTGVEAVEQEDGLCQHWPSEKDGVIHLDVVDHLVYGVRQRPVDDQPRRVLRLVIRQQHHRMVEERVVEVGRGD